MVYSTYLILVLERGILYSIFSILSLARDMVLFIHSMYFLVRGSIQNLFNGILGIRDGVFIVFILSKGDGVFNILDFIFGTRYDVFIYDVFILSNIVFSTRVDNQ